MRLTHSDHSTSLLNGQIDAISFVLLQLSGGQITSSGVGRRSLIRDDMTLGELGDLNTLNGKLQILARGIPLEIEVDLLNVPPGSLPSLTLEDGLRQFQRRAERVSGSDLGDSH